MTEEREGGKEVVKEEVRGEAEVLAGERDRGTESWKEERREKEVYVDSVRQRIWKEGGKE